MAEPTRSSGWCSARQARELIGDDAFAAGVRSGALVQHLTLGGPAYLQADVLKLAPIDGALAASEAGDATSFDGILGVIGAFASTEAGDDTAAFAGQVSEQTAAAKRHQQITAAIEERLNTGFRPASTETWDRFCDEVRKSCGVNREQRGYGDKTIKRIFRERDKRDNQDI